MRAGQVSAQIEILKFAFRSLPGLSTKQSRSSNFPSISEIERLNRRNILHVFSLRFSLGYMVFAAASRMDLQTRSVDLYTLYLLTYKSELKYTDDIPYRRPPSWEILVDSSINPSYDYFLLHV